MSEKKEKKVKGFRLDEATQTLVDQLITESGKEQNKWFEEVVQKLATNELVLEKEHISLDLRKHFSSDVSSLKDATTLITSIFLNQMNRISVEKAAWNDNLQNIITDYEGKQNKLKETQKQLESIIQDKDSELDSLNISLQQLQSKVEGSEKLEEEFRKSIDRLEQERIKIETNLDSLKKTQLEEKNEYIKNIEETKNDHKEEKDRLNQQIVDSLEKLKEFEPISKENEELLEKVRNLQEENRSRSVQYEVNLTRTQEQADVDKQKALLERERELRDQLHKENREDSKELYDKIEKLQTAVKELSIENSSLRTKK